MRKAKPEKFRTYTVIVENSVGVRSEDVRLVRSTSRRRDSIARAAINLLFFIL